MNGCSFLTTAEFKELKAVSHASDNVLEAFASRYVDEVGVTPTLSALTQYWAIKMDMLDKGLIDHRFKTIKGITAEKISELNSTSDIFKYSLKGGVVSSEFKHDIVYDSLVKLGPIDTPLFISKVSENEYLYNGEYYKSESEALTALTNDIEIFNADLDNISTFDSIAKHITSNFNIPVVLVNSKEATDKAKAYIKEGVIYLNTDIASTDDALHEVMHFVLAGVRMTQPELYYELVNNIDSHPRFDYYAQFYKDRVGADLKEEVLINLMQDRFMYHTVASKELDVLLPFFNNSIKAAFNLKGNLANTSPMHISAYTLSDVLKGFQSQLLTGKNTSDLIKSEYVTAAQKLAFIKNQLTQVDKIIETCHG